MLSPLQKRMGVLSVTTGYRIQKCWFIRVLVQFQKNATCIFLILENNFNVLLTNTFYIWIPLCFTDEYTLYMNTFMLYWWIHFIYEYLYVILMNTFYIWLSICYTDEYIWYMNTFMLYRRIHFIYEYLYVILMNTFYLWIPIRYTDEYTLYMTAIMLWWWIHFVHRSTTIQV